MTHGIFMIFRRDMVLCECAFETLCIKDSC